MKVSQIAAKVVVRLFLFLLLIALVPYFTDNAKLQNFNFVIREKWTLVFPAILIIGFVTFLVMCTIKKYKEIDLNWLLVVNTLVLMAYGVAIFIKVYHAVS